MSSSSSSSRSNARRPKKTKPSKKSSKSAGKRPMPANSIRQPLPAIRSKESQYAQKLLSMMTLPEEHSSPELFPLEYCQPVFTTQFQRIVDISSATHPGLSSFRVLLRPRTLNPLAISAGQDTVFPDAPGACRWSWLYKGPLSTAMSYPLDDRPIGEMALLDTGQAVIYTGAHASIDSADFVGVPGLLGTGVALHTLSITVNFPNPSSAQRARFLYCEKLSDGSYTARQVATINPSAGGYGETAVNINSSLNSRGFYISFGLTTVSGAVTVNDCIVSVAITPQAPGSAWQMTNTGISERVYMHGLSQVIDTLDIPALSLQCASMQITNTSPELFRSGKVITYRTADPTIYLTQAPLASKFGQVSALNKYRGEAKHGSYAFWMPEDAEEREMHSPADFDHVYRNSNVLVSEFSGLNISADAEWSFSITVTYIATFYHPSPMYPKRLSIANDLLYQAVLAAARTYPACSCNPEHVDKFRAAIKHAMKKGGDLATRGAKHWEEYGPYYLAAAQAVARLVEAL